MRAGWLRHRVTIQKKTTSQDSYGAEQETWTNVATVWAGIEPLRGREYIDAQNATAEVTHRVRIRYQSGITPRMRVSFGSRTFEIVSVINVLERNRELELMCREVVA